MNVVRDRLSTVLYIIGIVYTTFINNRENSHKETSNLESLGELLRGPRGLQRPGDS